MQVILLEKVRELGGLGDTVSVKAGYARNYLIPKGIALLATPENVAGLEARREELERREAEARATAGEQAAALEAVEITVLRRAGEGGRLFGSVGAVDIVRALAEAGHEVTRQQVRMPEGETVRQLGEFAVTIRVGAEVDATVRLKVQSESGGAPEPADVSASGDAPGSDDMSEPVDAPEPADTPGPDGA